MHERAPEVIEANYAHMWKQVLGQIEALRAEGETDLNRILSLMSSRYIMERYARRPGAKAAGGGQATLEDQMADTGCLFDARRVVPRKYDFLTMMRMFETVQISTFLSYIEPDVRRVIELGSGWGRILLKIWAMGAPREAEYIGCEITQSGRALSERIAEIGNVPNFRAQRFDYYQPDFSFAGADVPTVAVTNHSIEEIYEFPEAVIEGLCAIPGFRRCVHIEPVGFQIEDDTWLPDATNAERARIDEVNTEHARRFNRNHNLVPLLQRMHDEGRIVIERMEKNFLGVVVENASTLIVWRPR